MDVTNGSLDRFTQALPALVQKLTDAGSADEAEALKSIHGDLEEAIGGLHDLMDHFFDRLHAELVDLKTSAAVEVDKRISGLGAILQATGQAMQVKP